MKLSEKQQKFTEMVGRLIEYAYRHGYRLTFGCATCAKKGHHMANSLHYIRLAIDLNLFSLDENGDWVYRTNTGDYLELGEYWESIGGSWGGRFNDGNHFSLEHGGRR